MLRVYPTPRIMLARPQYGAVTRRRYSPMMSYTKKTSGLPLLDQLLPIHATLTTSMSTLVPLRTLPVFFLLSIPHESNNFWLLSSRLNKQETIEPRLCI